MQREVVLQAATRYLRRHPGEVGRFIRSLVGLRLGVPIDLLRWLGEQAEGSGKVDDIEVDPVPPGVRVAATVDLMRTTVRASAVLYIERMVLTGEQMRIELRLEDVALTLMEDSDSPVAMLIKSGALDLSRPGNLVKHMPDLPPVLVEAEGKRIVLDLMRHPKIGANGSVRNVVSLFTSLLTVHGVETDEHHVDVSFRAFPDGVFKAAREVRRHLIVPGIRRARLFLPGSRG